MPVTIRVRRSREDLGTRLAGGMVKLQPTRPPRYSALQRVLHWVVAILVLAQVRTGWEIAASHVRAAAHMNHVGLHSDWTMVAHRLHLATGLVIAALVVWRLWLRYVHAALSPPPVATAVRIPRLAGLVHGLIYLVLIALAATGFVAMYLVRGIGAVHVWLWNAFVILAILHVAAACWHAFVLRKRVRVTLPPLLGRVIAGSSTGRLKSGAHTARADKVPT